MKLNEFIEQLQNLEIKMGSDFNIYLKGSIPDYSGISGVDIIIGDFYIGMKDYA